MYHRRLDSMCHPYPSFHPGSILETMDHTDKRRNIANCYRKLAIFVQNSRFEWNYHSRMWCRLSIRNMIHPSHKPQSDCNMIGFLSCSHLDRSTCYLAKMQLIHHSTIAMNYRSLKCRSAMNNRIHLVRSLRLHSNTI